MAHTICRPHAYQPLCWNWRYFRNLQRGRFVVRQTDRDMDVQLSRDGRRVSVGEAQGDGLTIALHGHADDAINVQRGALAHLLPGRIVSVVKKKRCGRKSGIRPRAGEAGGT